MSTMEEDTSATIDSTMGSADPSGVAARSEPSAEPRTAAAEPDDVGAVGAATRAQLERRLKLTQRDAKHARLNRARCCSQSRREPQPTTGSMTLSRRTYVQMSLRMHSTCKLCWLGAQGGLDRAKVKSNQSTTNLLRRLNSCEAARTTRLGKEEWVRQRVIFDGGKKREIGSYFGPDTVRT